MATERIRLNDPEQEMAAARQMALRYRYEFVDLKEGRIDHELFKSVPVDLMFRYNFVPLHSDDGTLEIALADPRNLN
ncbi:MAG: pilus assembly protein PilB, partial [Bryobacteraceae bacterium]|nr:pilus assembly protein PilB [Bryobacteraceae bacterium]